MGLDVESFTAQQLSDELGQLPVVVDDEKRPRHALTSIVSERGRRRSEEEESGRKDFLKPISNASSFGTSFASVVGACLHDAQLKLRPTVGLNFS